MSLTSDRARRAEKRMSATLKTERVKNRPRYQKAPDAVPIRLLWGPGAGLVLMPESKERAELPKWLLDAVAQARKYVPGAMPLVVLTPLGGEQLGVMALKDLTRVLGIDEPKPGEQLILGSSNGGGG